MRGKFIVLEGLDGSGKTTQANLLKSYLEEAGHQVVFQREPGGTSVSERLRSIILDRNITDMHPLTEMYLYAAARCQLVHQVILPALEAGKTVILDRFLLSSIAYQGFGRKLGAKTVEDVNQLAIAGLEPDLTVLFDMEKRDDRMGDNRDRIELSSDAFFQRVYEGYMTSYDRARTVVIDAGQTIEAISQSIINRVRELF